MSPTTFRRLELDVIETGGLMKTTMEVLRDLVGAGKLGVYVLDEIRRALRKSNLVVLGGHLPRDQRDTVWLISSASDEGQLLLEVLSMMRAERQTRPVIDTHGEAA